MLPWSFEVYTKCGLNWAYKGIFKAVDSRQAAVKARHITGSRIVKVRPEDSRDKFLVYRFSA